MLLLLLLPLLLVSVVVVVELLLMRKHALRFVDDAGMVNADAVNDDDDNVTPTLVSVAKDDNNAHPTIAVAENVGTLVMFSFQS
jgi:hypothetical protein